MNPRLDAELVRRGLARSRSVAAEAVAEGRVTVDGVRAAKPSHTVAAEARLVVDQASGWVGRAAAKLDAALTAYAPHGLSVRAKRAVDVGASTGGFTQVLLAHGAAEVAAIDVGHHQLAPLLARDPRVHDYSGVSVRGLEPSTVGGPGDILVADLSFISLTLVLPDLLRLVRPGADLVLLVKPQFEVGRTRLGKNGIVRDPHDRRLALTAVAQAARAVACVPAGVMRSPVTGGHGNTEYLLWLRSPRDGNLAVGPVGGSWQALEEQIDDLVHQESP